MDEAKKSCASVRENSEFYRGALALTTFPVSEVNIAPRIRPDFGKISHCEGGSLLKRSPKRALFDEKGVLTVGDKTPESVTWKIILVTRCDVDGVSRLAQICF